MARIALCVEVPGRGLPGPSPSALLRSGLEAKLEARLPNGTNRMARIAVCVEVPGRGLSGPSPTALLRSGLEANLEAKLPTARTGWPASTIPPECVDPAPGSEIGGHFFIGIRDTCSPFLSGVQRSFWRFGTGCLAAHALSAQSAKWVGTTTSAGPDFRPTLGAFFSDLGLIARQPLVATGRYRLRRRLVPG
jgi:hypothetical protein